MPRGLIIVGASHAGVQLAAKCREMGYQEPITLINGEHDLPYQRPPLSKNYLTQDLAPYDILLRPERFFSDSHIQLLSGKKCVRIDRQDRTVELDGGRRLHYDSLVLATGAHARGLPKSFGTVPRGVINLRDLDDARLVRDAVWSPKKVVIVGGGLIGLELASTFSSVGCDVSLVEFHGRLLARSCSPDIAQAIEELHRTAGVDVHLEAGIAEIHARAARLHAVTLTNGRRLDTDMCLFAIGASPNIDLALDAGLACANGVVVDQFMRTSDPAILAVGDCTIFPSVQLGRMIRLECIQNAHGQAATAAATLTGSPAPYIAPPVFWSDQRLCKFQRVGFLDGVDLTVRRDGEAGAFSLWHFVDRRLRAVESLNSVHDQALARQLLAKQAPMTPEQVANPRFQLRAALGN
ncbi:FAD-dependent oxidoreductase (plasmid) [Rhizobium sp. CB3090]|uniref:NAD(P)/FAD-dependent oxidoreductase n=1 Tax=Rhizobium sp. CB3090 TaxID=3039156 RepID=UPI0024B0C0AA|nr:FAD-dependent oxidoreductase [Rhizobium sp. CB3090]WFU12904.1 FAD-dependent oxidoreductase [Rhizobium sp. CB3090]